MAEDKVEGREVNWQRLLPWALLFRTFQVTLDLNKLLLAAGGILVTAFWWWLLALVFAANRPEPQWPGTYGTDWQQFRRDRQHWNLMHEAIGLTRGTATFQPEDIAETLEEYDRFASKVKGPDYQQSFLNLVAESEKSGTLRPSEARYYRGRAAQYTLLGQEKPAGRLVVGPWFEDRGPNPYLLVSGQAGVPWEAGHFWEWFGRNQMPVMLEPLVKLMRPVIYFLSPRNEDHFTSRAYFFLVTLFTVLTWSFFGGAITRIAAVQLTRGERIGLIEAARFTFRRIVSYIAAPLFPLTVVVVLMILLGIFGALAGITYLVGDIVFYGLLWPLPLLFGLIMAMALVGLVSWPLMAATISTEGTDSWEAVTRAYGYVYQRPWYYAWCALVSLVYGGIVIFFVGFMGSLTVYLAKWGVNNIVARSIDREPNYLFIYAPTSFGWRELLMEGTQVTPTEEQKRENELLARMSGADVVGGRLTRQPGAPGVGGVYRGGRLNEDAYTAYVATLSWWNKLGAALVAFWLGLAFLLVLGFGYVFFWTASTITYLLLRKSLESAELDEVYMEEEDYEATFSMPPYATAPPGPAGTPVAPAPAGAAPAGGPVRSSPLPVVEAPPAPPASPANVATPTPSPAPAAPAPAPAPTPPTPAPAPAPTPTPPPAPPAASPSPPATEQEEPPPVPPDEDR